MKSVQLESLIAAGQTLVERHDAMEMFRDCAADQFERVTGSSWRRRSGSQVNHSALTATLIDSRDFLAAKRRAETDVMLPPGPKVAFSGSADYNDHRTIWDLLDKVRTKHPGLEMQGQRRVRAVLSISLLAWALSLLEAVRPLRATRREMSCEHVDREANLVVCCELRATSAVRHAQRPGGSARFNRSLLVNTSNVFH